MPRHSNGKVTEAAVGLPFMLYCNDAGDDLRAPARLYEDASGVVGLAMDAEAVAYVHLVDKPVLGSDCGSGLGHELEWTVVRP